MALANDTTLRAVSNHGQGVRVSDTAAAEFQGTNIYGLTRFVTPDGRPHLIGTLSKRGRVIDFTTGKDILDQTKMRALLTADAGAPAMDTTIPASGGDSYCAHTTWTNPANGKKLLVLGGWYLLSAPFAGGVFDPTYKHSYVLATEDLVNWTVILDVTLGSSTPTAWRCEVTELLGTKNFLYIMRADGTSQAGIYSWDGTTPITLNQVTGSAAMNGVLRGDEIKSWGRGSTTVLRVNALTAAPVNALSLATQPSRISGQTRTADTVQQGAIGHLGGHLVLGCKNGFFLDRTAAGAASSTATYVPLLIAANSGFDRVFGWRSEFVNAGGGLVGAVNVYDTASGGQGGTQSVLVWIGPTGAVKVLDVGGYYGGITVHDGRLYYGITQYAHGGEFSAHQIGGVTLESIPLEDLKHRVVPLLERINYTYASAGAYGENGRLGGWPTYGYKQGSLILTSSAAATLTFSTWGPQMDEVDLPGTLTFGAGDTKIIDLAPYLTGGLLGFRLSADTTLTGQAYFA